ncbi:unnamed protein product [Mytilus edulis]|uniref:Uncharacterized protein n=1 Tax=Mytilus edulis TaxID=6550 RepID=A0A8S3PPJ9_MYTED|nr:unnamed protein product [Mytilus edulis]
MSALEDYEDSIRNMIEQQGYTCAEVSSTLKTSLNITKGSSQSSIYKFCLDKNIHKYNYGRMSKSEIKNITTSAVQVTGPTYGRKLVTGFLRSKGYNLGERSVRTSLLDISPFYVAQRRAVVERNTNPSAYYAEYAGHKLHMDQNEKQNLESEVLASDGFSGKITAYALMPFKNNLLKYDNVYKSTCLKYGLFDQIRVDFGKEFYLCLYKDLYTIQILGLYHQENVKQYRTNTNRPEYIQTMSRQNHAAERKWVEVNSRINYPLKCVLRKMSDDFEIDMNDPVTKFCVSQLTMQCCNIGFQQLIPSWNAHSIPGKGIPDRLFASNLHTQRLPCIFFPPSEVVAEQYMQDGGRLTMPGPCGIDPLECDQALKERVKFSQT